MAPREARALNATAAGWLAKQQRDDFTRADREELERWLQADPANAVAYARAEHAWQRAERLRAVPTTVRRGFSIPRFPSVRAVAAVFLAVVALAASLWWGALRPEIYASGVGERRTVALEDGSHIDLNTASRIEVDYADDRRTVHLTSGEALFDVAKDSRPFIVEGGGAVVRAVGTQFNVRLRGQVVEVTVAEGIVAVGEEHYTRAQDAAPAPSQVAAGSAAVIGPGAVTKITLEEEVVRRRLAWREGVIELKGETLDQAVAEFNRYRSAKLLIADPRIASIRVGGRFKVNEAEKFLGAVQAGFAVRLVEGGDGTVYLLAQE